MFGKPDEGLLNPSQPGGTTVIGGPVIVGGHTPSPTITPKIKTIADQVRAEARRRYLGIDVLFHFVRALAVEA